MENNLFIFRSSFIENHSRREQQLLLLTTITPHWKLPRRECDNSGNGICCCSCNIQLTLTRTKAGSPKFNPLNLQSPASASGSMIAHFFPIYFRRRKHSHREWRVNSLIVPPHNRLKVSSICQNFVFFALFAAHEAAVHETERRTHKPRTPHARSSPWSTQLLNEFSTIRD